jgi:hypothetical protein
MKTQQQIIHKEELLKIEIKDIPLVKYQKNNRKKDGPIAKFLSLISLRKKCVLNNTKEICNYKYIYENKFENEKFLKVFFFELDSKEEENSFSSCDEKSVNDLIIYDIENYNVKNINKEEIGNIDKELDEIEKELLKKIKERESSIETKYIMNFNYKI